MCCQGCYHEGWSLLCRSECVRVCPLIQVQWLGRQVGGCNRSLERVKQGGNGQRRIGLWRADQIQDDIVFGRSGNPSNPNQASGGPLWYTGYWTRWAFGHLEWETLLMIMFSPPFQILYHENRPHSASKVYTNETSKTSPIECSGSYFFPHYISGGGGIGLCFKIILKM